jgi:serine/threonine protein kinase
LCDALSYLHSRQPKIIHRDIKPGNVKITPGGQIILVDFGLAKTLQSGQSTTTGARAMTPGYSPPEQYGTARTDERSDIYSLGATLYVALTGELPEDALARAMGQSELTPVRRYNPKVSRKLAGAIEKAMELRPEDRFHSADEFKQALLNTRIITGKVPTGDNALAPAPLQASGQTSASNGVSAPPQPLAQENSSAERSGGGRASLLPTSTPILEPGYEAASPKPARRVRRRRGCWFYLLILGGLVAALIAGIIIYQPSLWNEVNRAAGRVLSSYSIPLNLAFLAPKASPTLTDTLPVPSQTLEPENPATRTPLVNNVVSPMTGTFTPTLTRTSQPTSTPTPTPPPLPTVTATPNGSGGGLIAYASDVTGLPQIWVMNTEGKEKRQVINMQEGACQPAWAPDGVQLVFISPCLRNQESYPGASLHIVSVDGTGYRSLPSQPGGDFDPAWSPDGTQILFTSMRDSNLRQIYSFNLEDGTTKSISNNTVNNLQPSWSPDGTQIVFITTRKSIYQIYIMAQDGSNEEPFYSSGELENSHPVWSPDGDWIMFTQNRKTNKIPRIMVAPVPDAAPEFSVPPVDTPLYGKPMKEAVYSADGLWIAFEGYPGGFASHDIYIMNAFGLFFKQLTDNPGTDFDAAWQPAVIP